MKKLITICLFFLSFQSVQAAFLNIRTKNLPLIHFSGVREGFNTNLEIMFKTSSRVSLGLIGYKYSDRNKTDHNYKLNSINAGARLDFMLTGESFEDGFYFTDAILYGEYESSYDLSSSSYQTTGNNLVATVGLGYQWFWKSGVNFNIGGGYIESRTLSQKVVTEVESDDGPVKNGNYTRFVYDLGFGICF